MLSRVTQGGAGARVRLPDAGRSSLLPPAHTEPSLRLGALSSGRSRFRREVPQQESTTVSI